MCINGMCKNEPDYCTPSVRLQVFWKKDFLDHLISVVNSQSMDESCTHYKETLSFLKNDKRAQTLYDLYGNKSIKDNFGCGQPTDFMNCVQSLGQTLFDVAFDNIKNDPPTQQMEPMQVIRFYSLFWEWRKIGIENYCK